MGANEKEDTTEFDTEDANGQANDLTDRFIVAYASRGFHEYRKIWKPKLRQRLRVAFEKYNVYNPYCCALYARSKADVLWDIFRESYHGFVNISSITVM